MKNPNGILIACGTVTLGADAYWPLQVSFIDTNYSLVYVAQKSGTLLGNKFTYGFGIQNGSSTRINFIAIGKWK